MNPEPQQARRRQRATGAQNCEVHRGARLLGEQIRDRYEWWSWCACAHHTRSRAGNRGCSEHAKMVLHTQTRMFNTAHANEDFTENKHVCMLERDPTRGYAKALQMFFLINICPHASTHPHRTGPLRWVARFVLPSWTGGLFALAPSHASLQSFI